MTNRQVSAGARVVVEPGHKGALDAFELNFVRTERGRARPTSWFAIANMLGRTEADIRRVCDPAHGAAPVPVASAAPPPAPLPPARPVGADRGRGRPMTLRTPWEATAMLRLGLKKSAQARTLRFMLDHAGQPVTLGQLCIAVAPQGMAAYSTETVAVYLAGLRATLGRAGLPGALDGPPSCASTVAWTLAAGAAAGVEAVVGGQPAPPWAGVARGLTGWQRRAMRRLGLRVGSSARLLGHLVENPGRAFTAAALAQLGEAVAGRTWQAETVKNMLSEIRCRLTDRGLATTQLYGAGPWALSEAEARRVRELVGVRP